MIRISAIYPNKEGGRFDMDYYVNKHLPMVREILGDAVKKIEIFKGLGAVGNQPAAFTVLSHLYFDSMEAFTASLTSENGGKIFQDIPNYTDIEAILQIEEPV